MPQKVLSAAVLMALAGSAVASSSPSLADLALGHSQNHRAELRASGSDQFAIRNVFVDASTGFTVAHLDRHYQGLPVIGGDVVERFRGNQFIGANHKMTTTARPSIIPSISADEAVVNAGADFGTGFQGKPTSRLVIYAVGVSPMLAHEVVFSGVRADQTPTEMHYFVSAKDGRILNKWDTIQTASASGTGKTLYSGDVALTTHVITTGFELLDPSRGNNKTINGATGRTSGTIYKDSDNVWGNNSSTDLASGAADAQFGGANTWDFYKNALGRTGIDGKGRGSYNRVHFGKKFNNAFWSDSCYCMTFGDGDGVNLGPLVSLDIAGHEMSHGVTSRTAGLVYSGESGGLNEANSDMMGTMAEFYANNAIDTGDYMIGEMIYAGNVNGNPDQTALRYMFNPSKDTLSPNCYYAGIGSIDVHFSSGPANLFFYLLAEGTGAKTFSGVDHTPLTTCNSTTLTGIGRTKAQLIWYTALSAYMTSTTNFADARAATISAATALIGTSGITAGDVTAVGAAWSAVNVN